MTQQQVISNSLYEERSSKMLMRWLRKLDKCVVEIFPVCPIKNPPTEKLFAYDSNVKLNLRHFRQTMAYTGTICVALHAFALLRPDDFPAYSYLRVNTCHTNRECCQC